MVAGGAVSVLRLHNRSATKDVDFYTSDEAASLLIEKGGEAVARILKYGADWLNSDVSFFIDADPNHARLLDDSIAQGYIIFASPQLVAYASQYEWQLVSKIRRLGSEDEYDKSLSDAVALLRALVEKNDLRPLAKSTIKGYYPAGQFITEDLFAELAVAYEKTYGEMGLQ